MTFIFKNGKTCFLLPRMVDELFVFISIFVHFYPFLRFLKKTFISRPDGSLPLPIEIFFSCEIVVIQYHNSQKLNIFFRFFPDGSESSVIG
jgi:hypothetical protein